MIKALFPAIILSIILLLSFENAFGKNYTRQLVKDLIELEYPVDAEDVIALDKVSMRFDNKNRYDILKSILDDREKIHNLKKGDYFKKTEVICNALHLLDELDLPLTNEIIVELTGEQGWEKREMILLSYMAAKRDIDYEKNKKYLIESLLENRLEGQEDRNDDISFTIIDICDNISFLSELFAYKGDREILGALIGYAGHAYGYPAEHLSRMFAGMFIQRPQLFIDVLSEKDVQRTEMVIDSLIFGISNGNVRGKINEVLETIKLDKDYSNHWAVRLLREKLEDTSINLTSQ